MQNKSKKVIRLSPTAYEAYKRLPHTMPLTAAMMGRGEAALKGLVDKKLATMTKGDGKLYFLKDLKHDFRVVEIGAEEKEAVIQKFFKDNPCTQAVTDEIAAILKESRKRKVPDKLLEKPVYSNQQRAKLTFAERSRIRAKK